MSASIIAEKMVAIIPQIIRRPFRDGGADMKALFPQKYPGTVATCSGNRMHRFITEPCHEIKSP